MRTTLDLDKKLFAEARRYSPHTTKTALIHDSLREFIRRRKLEELADMGGKTRLSTTAKEVRRLRDADGRA